MPISIAWSAVSAHRNPRANKKRPSPASYTRRQDPEHYRSKLIARLAQLGYTVTVEPAKAA